MLVLSRKPCEQIRIGDKIVITVQKLSGNRVDIGVVAPQKVRIVRRELARRIKALSTDVSLRPAFSSCNEAS